MVFYDELQVPQEGTDTSLLLLLVAAGGAHVIDFDDPDNHLHASDNESGLSDFLQAIGLSIGHNPSLKLLNWIDSGDHDRVTQAFDSVLSIGEPQVLLIGWKSGEMIRHGYAVFTKRDPESDSLRLFALSPNSPIDASVLEKHKLCNVGSLAAGVAHDLNNLFTGMLSLVDLLNEDIPKKCQRHLDLLENTIERAEDLTDGMLTFLKGAPRSETGPIDPVGPIEAIGFLLAETLPEQIDFGLSFPEENCLVDINRAELGQVVLNLVINARDAIGNRSGRIDVSAIFKDDKFILSVSDSGPGLQASKIEKLFQPFYTTKQSQKGTGLGLTIVKTIVEEANGRIEVESEVGKGSRFIVILPVSF